MGPTNTVTSMMFLNLSRLESENGSVGTRPLMTSHSTDLDLTRNSFPRRTQKRSLKRHMRLGRNSSLAILKLENSGLIKHNHLTKKMKKITLCTHTFIHSFTHTHTHVWQSSPSDFDFLFTC